MSNNDKKYGNYKTILCKFWKEKGNCRLGASCVYAHGPHELSQNQMKPQHNKSSNEIYALRSSFNQISQREMKIAGNFKPNVVQEPNVINNYTRPSNTTNSHMQQPTQKNQPKSEQIQQSNTNLPQFNQQAQQATPNNVATSGNRP